MSFEHIGGHSKGSCQRSPEIVQGHQGLLSIKNTKNAISHIPDFFLTPSILQ